MSIGIVAREVAVPLANRLRCPLTGSAARYATDRRANFDICLPLWLVRYNQSSSGSLFALGVLYAIVQACASLPA